MADVFCNACGHRNRDGSNFCSSCGGLLEVAGQDHATIVFHPQDAVDDPDADVSIELDRVPADEGVLVVRRGPNAGSKFALGPGTTSIGRHPESDIFLDDVTVSRQHAEIESSDGAHRVRDGGSLNGTYVNRERIEEIELQNGDEVQIGTFKLVYFASPQGA